MAAVTASNINLVQLEEALEVDSENLEQLQYWYEQLSEVRNGKIKIVFNLNDILG